MDINIFLICLMVAVMIVTFLYVICLNRKITRDVNDFFEAVKYRDFSRKFTENNKRKRWLYSGFNTINETFLSLNKEKEVKQQYLKRILELVDTGILAYDTETFDVLLTNEVLINMFKIPHIKNAHWLKKRNEHLYNELLEIPLGASRLITINTDNQSIKTLANASVFQAEGRNYKLIAFHNINSTLEEIESSAWKGLLNVMTHEIMNSIAPVSSLADTMEKRIGSMKKEMDADHLPDCEDIELAMGTIRRRSEGLLRFANTYRNLSKTIELEKQEVNLHELMKAVYQLMFPSFQQKGIQLEIKTNNPGATAFVDRGLMEQVVINCVTNAMYAVRKNPEGRIVLFSGINAEKQLFLTVADNGCGISMENRDRIFIPFFSTKKNGSGIGLSLSREIVKLHDARLQVQSQEGRGSVFTVLFSESK